MGWTQKTVVIPLEFGVANETIELNDIPEGSDRRRHLYTEPFRIPENLIDAEAPYEIRFEGYIFTKGGSKNSTPINNESQWDVDGAWIGSAGQFTSSFKSDVYWEEHDLDLFTEEGIDMTTRFRYHLWTARGNMEIATENMSKENYRPYINIYAWVKIPTVSGLTPNNAIVDPRKDIILKWNHSGGDGVQESFKLQYSINLGDWVVVEETTPRQSYTIPPSTLPGDANVRWRVETKDTGLAHTSDLRSASFTTAKIIQKAPIISGPIKEFLVASLPIVFKWVYDGDEGEAQEGYEVAYSVNGGESYINIKGTSKESEAVFPPHTFPTGVILWKVRTTDDFGDVSPWSDISSFNVIGEPATPTIQSVSNNAKPIIKWTSQGQEIYEIEVLQSNVVVFKSGKIPSSIDREYRVEEYLEDGSYTARLRIWNEFDLHSEYGAKNFILDTPKPSKANISVISGEYGVTVEVEGKDGIAMLYRDDKPIGEVEGNAFIDYTGENNKSHVYFVRNINNEGNFTDSDKEVAGCSFRGNTLAIVDAPGNFINLRYGFGDTPGKQENKNTLGELNHYDGRVYPVVEHSEFKSLNKNLKFHIMDKEELNLLVRLVDAKKTMIYRDHFGDNIEGSILSINVVRSRYGYDVDFTINKTGV